MKILYITLFFSTFSIAQPLINGNYSEKVLTLKTNIGSYKNSTRFSKKELLKIVIPEYVSYNPIRDEFEKYLIRFFYSIKNEEFKNISFGPLQMQPEFILNNTNINSYSDIIREIDSLSSISRQYEILIQYVNNNSSFSIKEIINLYNSGNKNLELKFKKNNYKMTYYEFSNYLINEFY